MAVYDARRICAARGRCLIIKERYKEKYDEKCSNDPWFYLTSPRGRLAGTLFLRDSDFPNVLLV